MQIFNNHSLKKQNTFAVNAVSPTVYQLTDPSHLPQVLSTLKGNFYVMGQGSNTLFVEDTAPPILMPDFKGVKVGETSTHYLLDVAAGENWHDLVVDCVNQGICGLEKLSTYSG